MGASSGKVVGDQGEGIGISTVKAGKNSDDDEDFNWDYGEQGGRIQEGDAPRQALDKLQIVEQARQNLSHQRHKRLHARQESDGAFLEVTSTLDPSSLSIILPSPSLVSSLPTDINTSLPIGSSLQTFLSSTPPPSPVQTSPGMTIPLTTTTAVSSATPPPSQNLSDIGPSTTITSYWTSLSSRNNGTSLANSRVSTTIDGTVVVFAIPTDTVGTNFSTTGNNSTNSSTPTNTTAASIVSSSISTNLWAPETMVVSGVGGGFVAPATNTVTAPSAPTTETPAGNSSPPVSPSLLGGVLGGVAGLAFILVVILYLIRRHKREVAAVARDDAGYGGPLGSSGGNPMTEGSSTTPFALAGSFFARHSRTSRVSESSEAPTVLSETGFYKISGRKLPPVLGGPRPGYGSTRSAGASSSYPDEDGGGWVGGSGTVASTPSIAGPSRYSSIASASPTISNAPMSSITPVPAPVSAAHIHMGSSMAPPPPRIQEEASESDTESTHQLPRPPLFPRQLSAVSIGSAGKDPVGRSLPSHDGSRASRFTEDIV